MDDLEQIPEWAQSALALEPEIAERAERYRFMDETVVVGRGLNYANAFEFALKMMETSYVVAERFSSADFLHGPIAMVHEGFPVFAFAPAGVTWPGMQEMLEKLDALKAETLVITDRGNEAAWESGRRTVTVPEEFSGDLYTPIPYIIPAQLFAACLAQQKGLNPDKPRTLSKVTRTM